MAWRAMRGRGGRWALLGGLVILGLILVTGGMMVFTTTPEAPPETASVDQIGLGQELYAEYCSSCHGVELQGQPDWRTRTADGTLPAPPHDATGHTWHHPDQQLFMITKLGTAALVGPDYKSNMPAFGDVLNDAEIRAILAYIKSRWPEEIRRRQAEATERAAASE